MEREVGHQRLFHHPNPIGWNNVMPHLLDVTNRLDCSRILLRIRREMKRTLEMERNMEDVFKEKALIVDAEKCTGCKVCELVCSMAKHGQYNPQKSYIKVLRNWEMDVNVVALDLHCDFCNECVDWCDTKAIRFVGPEEAAVLRENNRMGFFPAHLFSCS